MEKDAFSYEITDGCVTITRWKLEERVAVIPGQVDGCPVVSLGDYALSGGSYEKAELPPSLRKIGKYAFYNCFKLKSLKFFASIEDVGAGAFTGCHKVKRLDVTVGPQGRSCLRDILMELTEEIAVDYHGEQEARLLFPEFYEEGVENTPARILMTQVHGSGLYYRNCFEGGRLNFGEYDSRFGLARAQESERFSLRLAMRRLFYPYRLEERAGNVYREYVTEHLEAAGDYLVEQGDLSHLRCLSEGFLPEKGGQKALEAWIYRAQELEQTEILSYLMELRHRKYPVQRKIFEL
ncbi:MAG: leucine-rich repeat protein [Blautia sp.]|jgi:hypothetical protein